MINIGASEKQKQIILAICELIGFNRYDNKVKNIISNRELATSFISKSLDSFYKHKQDYKINILKNINFEWLLLNLGYVKTDKSSINSPQYRLGKDIVNLRIDNSQNAKINSDVFNYFIFHTLDDRKNIEPPQIEFDNIPANNKRNFDGQINGNLINFIKDRALAYSEEQILFVLNEIAKDKDKIKYFFKNVNVIEYDFKINETKILNKEEKNKKCLDNFNKLKTSEESDSNYEIRGINLKIYSECMHQKYKAFVIPERIDNSTRDLKDFSTIFFNKTKDSIIKSIVCPIFNIKDDGFLSVVGFQKNPIINPEIFNIAKKIEKEHYHDIMEYIKKEDKNIICSDEDVINVYEKLSKKSFPEDVKNSPELMSIITAMLKVQQYNGYNEETKTAIWKTELVNPTKKKGQGSLSGVAIVKKPMDLNKKQAIAIFENPIFDGFSALKLGYFGEYDVTIVGSLGTVTNDFLQEINKMFFMGHPYEKLFIMFDNDEAGMRNKAKIEDSFLKELKKQLLKIVDCDENKINNFKNIQEVCHMILNKGLYNSQNQKNILEKLSKIEVVSLTAKNGKDFNEELLTQDSYNTHNNFKGIKYE